MPTITLRIDEIEKRGIVAEELAKLIEKLGMSVEKTEGKSITLEITPNRPDLLEVNGLCRALRFISGKRVPKENTYTLKNKPYLNIAVMSSVKSTRPFFCGIVAKGVDLSGDKLTELINFQEKLTETYGRKRKKMGMGLHDLKAIKGDLKYDAVKKGKMAPLGLGKEMEFAQIMKQQKTGIEYKDIIDEYGSYPTLSDQEKVIALIPISSSQRTKVTQSTKDLFVDIAGTSKTTVEDTGNIIASLLIDAGAEVYPCRIVYEKSNKNEITPGMKSREMHLRRSTAESTIGIMLDESKIIGLANKMGYVSAKYGNKILFFVPPYRVDVIAEQDLVEDVAIAYGYDKINPTPVYSNSVGLPEELRTRTENISSIMLGLGFTEAMNLYLTNETNNFGMMDRPASKNNYVSVVYAKTESISMLRTAILPSLLSNLFYSKSESMPQKMFEVGNVFTIDKGKPIEGFNLAIVIEHPKSNFSEIKSNIMSLCTLLGIKNVSLKEAKDPSFIDGRCAALIIGGQSLGMFGEIHPKVLSNFKIDEPVVAAELDLARLFAISNA